MLEEKKQYKYQHWLCGEQGPEMYHGGQDCSYKKKIKNSKFTEFLYEIDIYIPASK